MPLIRNKISIGCKNLLINKNKSYNKYYEGNKKMWFPLLYFKSEYDYVGALLFKR